MLAVVAVPDAVAALRARFCDRVARGDVQIAREWGRACHAVNVQFELADDAAAGLWAVQDSLVVAAPSLLRGPMGSLHVSIDWLLEVTHTYVPSTAALLAAHEADWVEALQDVARKAELARLRFRWVIVTDSAVIAVAEPNAAVSGLRRAIRAAVHLPEPVRAAATIVHTTLFRYAGVIDDPETLLARAAAMQIDIAAPVHTIVLSEELRFPSLHTRTLARFPLGSAAA